MIIDMHDFGLKEGPEHDNAIAVYWGLKACRNEPGAVLRFPQGTYHFRPEKATERFLYITNHDQGGTRRIAFPIAGFEGLTIDGQGSAFIFHGPMIPFLVEGSKGVTLKNVTVDWERPMFDQGTVAAVGDDWFDIRLRDGVEHEFRDNRLFFRFGGRMEPVWGLHDIDPATMAHAYGSGDRISWSSFARLSMEQAAPGVARVTGPIRHMPKEGHLIAMRFGRRENPGVFLKDSEDIRIERVTVHHAPGMGLVAQRCADIALERFDVKLRERSGRVVTATADAVHFTNCRGAIVIEHCLFENQLDDPCNVHGIYSGIVERLSDRTVLVRYLESMTIGIGVAEPGDTMRFVRRESLLGYAEGVVDDVSPINGTFVAVTFKEPLPDTIGEGDVLENATWNADLTVRHCTVRANRARGFLITTPGKVLLESNTISAPGAGIKISGDANSWYESGAVRDVTIRGNVFLDCNTCPDWGRAVIDIDPEIEEPERFDCYHRNIRIEDNTFRTFDTGLVYGRSVDGFTFRRNTIERPRHYPARGTQKHAIELTAARNVDIADNVCADGPGTALVGTDEYPIGGGKR
ncbi:right-handed parallel beta-helix repeat-containing protein [Paenibacillus flagellatus]|uniref:right-handed parallel beta-helix repeat-containing protein n=1 Tax=Paenibacillus flagellatus TaxID=2211139 RepID=UPI0011B66A0E|nr:right-handed parallel beta-helix repeat-containing protein [Paenibacillus flagellatus]